MKKVLQDIISNSRWQYPCFDGKLIIEGRILSVSESEVCGLTSALIAKSIINPDELKELQAIKEEEISEKNYHQIYKMLKNFKPEQVLKMSESQNKILVQTIKRGSSDKGHSWQDLKVVLQEHEQSAASNRLWVGMFNGKDRKNMIDLALSGHNKATEAIRGLV